MEFLRQLQLRDDARTEALRGLGGILLGVGVLVLLFRTTSFEDPWADFPVLVAWLIPALVLYGGGIAAARAGVPKGWHSVWVVFGILFVYGSLIQFLNVIEGDPDAPLNTVWTFLVVAAAAAIAAIFARVRFGWLVAGVAVVIAWLAFWDEILENGVFDDLGTFRGLCMVATVGLVAAAWMAERRGREGLESAELVTAAGLIFILGAGLVSIVGIFGSAFAPVDVTGAAAESSGQPSLFWDVVLLAGSIALIAAGSLVQVRGPIYVGGAGLLSFVVLVGGDLDDDSPAGEVVGWPLLLLIFAALAIAASLVAGRKPVRNPDQAP